MADDFKFHIDHHASLVRPVGLRDAADAVDAAILDALRMQRRLGLAALSDGEFRRRNWLSVVYDGVDGFAEPGGSPVCVQLIDHRHVPEVRMLLELPREHGRLVKQETDFLLSSIQRPSLLALPAPGFLAELCAGSLDVADIGAAFARILRAEIAAAAADGIRHVLLRNPAYGLVLRSGEVATFERMLAADAQVLDGLETDPEFRVSLDITTGGAARGSYDDALVRRFLAEQPFGRLCVEYPAAGQERFPLSDVPPGLVVSLGVVDVSSAQIEDVDELVARIDDATAFLDVDDIAISTNGGFHLAPERTAEEQHAKLQLVEMTARYFWGNEL